MGWSLWLNNHKKDQTEAPFPDGPRVYCQPWTAKHKMKDVEKLRTNVKIVLKDIYSAQAGRAVPIVFVRNDKR